MRVIVIMAGGTGERFWPMSSAAHPKQLLTLTSSGQSLLAEAVQRSMALVPKENIYVATSRLLQKAIIDAKLGIPDENVLAEPAKRNTAGCLIYASACILSRNCNLGPEGVTIGVLTADHRIPDTAPFVATASAAMDAAENTDNLVTIGIQPVRPDTAYGYIEIDPKKGALNKDADHPLYKAVRFHEKPDAAKAAGFIAGGHCYWNSGMFFWRFSTFQSEFGRANPVLAETLEDLTDALLANDNRRAEAIFEAMPNISIDYALMEKSTAVSVIPGKFIWDDLGSWDALSRTFPQDGQGNVSYGNPVLVDCKSSIVYNAAGDGKMAVAALGLENIVVVVKDNAVLVMPKDRAQEVRQVVSALRERGSSSI